MEIVPAGPEEATALQELHLATWEAAYRDHAGETWYVEQLAAHALRDWRQIIACQADRGGGVLSARHDGRPVGLCQYGRTGDRPCEGEIERLYVHQARQRTGIGRSLLAASVSCLGDNGVRVVRLWVLETDQRARAFYEALGWEPDGGRKVGPPADIRLRLSLR